MARMKDQPLWIREYAERLPDDMFDNDCQMKALREQIAKADARYKEAVENLRRFDTRKIEEQIKNLETEIKNEREWLPGKAYADLESGDTAFTTTMEARTNIQRLEWRLQALGDALAYYRTSGIESALRRRATSAAEEGSDTQRLLADRLEVLKIEAARRAA